MKKIDLNFKADTFMLWEKKYKYEHIDEDRTYFLKTILYYYTRLVKNKNIKYL